MYYTPEVDIPDPLIKALSEDKLVVFVGAGVSFRAYPQQNKNTYYPNFQKLVREIAQRLCRSLSKEQIKTLNQGFADRVLGELDDELGMVHETASEILQENEEKQRIELHRAIIRLFPRGATPRIVTTNFDNLLVAALEEEGVGGEKEWQIYEAPALPPPRRFSGICFLHGRVGKPNEMILTDKKIGRAYMDEGWALQFAHGLFSSFNVMFIGYSLQDPPLRYLSLALEGSKSREHYSFVSKQATAKSSYKLQRNERDWLRRGVITIWFPASRSDYRALERCISAWATDNRLGYVDKRNLLNTWSITSPKQLPPYQLDRAKSFLNMQELLRDFAGNDLHREWFEKLVEWGHLDYLLKSEGEPKESDLNLSKILAKWLFNEPIEWMLRLAEYRNTIHPTLFEGFLVEFQQNDPHKFDIKNLRALLEFFDLTIKKDKLKGYFNRIEAVLDKLIQGGFFADAIWLYTTGMETESKAVKRPDFQYLFINDSKGDTQGRSHEILEFEPDFTNNSIEYYAKEYLKKLFFPNVQKLGYLLLVILTRQLHDLRVALNRCGKDKYTYVTRKAIEPHNQDKYKEGPEHFFIDALRDLWEALLHIDADKAYALLNQWGEIDDVIFRRLCIYGTAKLLEIGYAF